MAKELRTVKAVVDALGGNTAVITLTGGSYLSAVSNWKKRGTFPASTHYVLTKALEKHSLQAPASLWGMREAENA
jgi:hypothetical protein